MKLITLIALLLVTSCVLPQKPGKNVIKSKEVVGYTDLTVYDIANKKKKHPIHRTNGLRKYKVKRNMLFVALDESVSPQFQPAIDRAYKKEGVTIEDITWWKMAPKLYNMYDKVVKIEKENRFCRQKSSTRRRTC